MSNPESNVCWGPVGVAVGLLVLRGKGGGSHWVSIPTPVTISVLTALQIFFLA